MKKLEELNDLDRKFLTQPFWFFTWLVMSIANTYFGIDAYYQIYRNLFLNIPIEGIGGFYMVALLSTYVVWDFCRKAIIVIPYWKVKIQTLIYRLYRRLDKHESR